MADREQSNEPPGSGLRVRGFWGLGLGFRMQRGGLICKKQGLGLRSVTCAVEGVGLGA